MGETDGRKERMNGRPFFYFVMQITKDGWMGREKDREATS